MLIGHIAVALLERRYLGTDLAPTVLGALYPDILDKTLCQVLHVTPNGRMWGHTLLSVGISTLFVRAAAGPRAARSWVLGYMGHLLADTAGTIPWWYPFRSYAFEPSPGFAEILEHYFEDRRKVALELVLLLWALVAFAVPLRRSLVWRSFSRASSR